MWHGMLLMHVDGRSSPFYDTHLYSFVLIHPNEFKSLQLRPLGAPSWRSLWTSHCEPGYGFMSPKQCSGVQRWFLSAFPGTLHTLRPRDVVSTGAIHVCFAAFEGGPVHRVCRLRHACGITLHGLRHVGHLFVVHGIRPCTWPSSAGRYLPNFKK